MGFWAEYFSTLLKGVRATAFKMRIETGKIIRNLRKADIVLYGKLIEHVKKEHKVTRAIREENALAKEFKKSAENCYSLMFNLSTDEMALLKSVENILKELHALSKNVKMQQIAVEIGTAIRASLGKAEAEERDEYKKILAIIKEAEDKNRNALLASIRLALQEVKAQTFLATFAMRQGISRIKTDLLQLKGVPSRIKALKSMTGEKAAFELRKEVQQIKKLTADAFYEIYVLQKRDTILMLKILFDINNLRTFNQKWVDEHNMPSGPVNDVDKKLEKVENTVAKDFHVIAQSLRILIADIQKDERLARTA